MLERNAAAPVASAYRTGLVPFDAVFDVVGGAGFGDWLGALDAHGRLVVAGAVAGPVVSIDLRQVYVDQRHIVGSTMRTREHFAELIDLARRGAVHPTVAAQFALDKIYAAQHASLTKDHVGKIVVTP